MNNYWDYSGLATLVVGMIVLLLKFGRQFIREIRALWNGEPIE